jgi:hypothetical protein
VKYKLSFYITEDGIIHSHRRENLTPYIALSGWTLEGRRNVSPVKYELGFYIPEDGVIHSHRRGNLKSCRYILHAGYSETLAELQGNVWYFVPTEI